MQRRSTTAASAKPEKQICCFCRLDEDNEIEYGKLHVYNGIVTHYYCLLLSSNMEQKGDDEEGILGFLPEDIDKELRRGKRLPCFYCKKTGATLGCCNTKCRRTFHFPCGLRSGTLHQFFGEFKSFCQVHRPVQKIDKRVLKELSERENMICYICYEEVDPHDTRKTLWAPCCKKNAWFHRRCVQQLAMSAGYFFKCPLCNNKVEFQNSMREFGIFIPSQDASWELVPNAYQELLYRHNRCDADVCQCPKGREHTSENPKWELTLCRTCGSQGIHVACGNLKWVKPSWNCGECMAILKNSKDRELPEVGSDSTRNGRHKSDEVSTDDESNSDESDISVGVDEQSMTDSEKQRKEQVVTRDFRLRNYSTSEIRRPGSSSGPIRRIERAILSGDEESTPLRKKPRLSDSFDESTEKSIGIGERGQNGEEPIDDDVIVISGPSTRKSSNSRCDDSRNGTNSFNVSQAEKKNNIAEKLKSTTNSGAQLNMNGGDATSGNLSTAEMNIKIVNVTSLDPKAFANVPELEFHSSVSSLPAGSSPVFKNYPGSSSRRNFDKIEIVCLDDTDSDHCGSSAAGALSADVTKNGRKSADRPNNENKDTRNRNRSPVYSTSRSMIVFPPGPKCSKIKRAQAAMKKLQMEKRKNAETTQAKVNMEKVKDETEKLSYSVPLTAVVNDCVMTSPLADKHNKTENPIEMSKFSERAEANPLSSKIHANSPNGFIDNNLSKDLQTLKATGWPCAEPAFDSAAATKVSNTTKCDPNSKNPSGNCDGDAGTCGDVQSARAKIPNATDNQRRKSGHPNFENNGNRNSCFAERTLPSREPAYHKNASSAIADLDYSDSDRAGLSEKYMSPRDLKFKVCGQNVKITFYDAWSVKVNIDNEKWCENNSWSDSDFQDESNRSDTRREGESRINVEDRESDFFADRSPIVESMKNIHKNPQAKLFLPMQTEDLEDGKNSRAQDDLKENLDPIPTCTNSFNNIAISIDNQKGRARSNIEDRETIEVDRNFRIIANHEQLSPMVRSKIPLIATSPNRASDYLAKKFVFQTPSSDVFDSRSEAIENREKSINIDNSYRLEKYSKNSDGLVNDAVNIDESTSCKVSIDLTRIRSILSKKLNSTMEIKLGRFPRKSWSGGGIHEKTWKIGPALRNRSKSFEGHATSECRSLDDLAIRDSCSEEQFSVSRKWKSVDDLSNRTRRQNGVNRFFYTVAQGENTKLGCKRKAQSVEKHDCVR